MHSLILFDVKWSLAGRILVLWLDIEEQVEASPVLLDTVTLERIQ